MMSTFTRRRAQINIVSDQELSNQVIKRLPLSGGESAVVLECNESYKCGEGVHPVRVLNSDQELSNQVTKKPCHCALDAQSHKLGTTPTKEPHRLQTQSGDPIGHVVKIKPTGFPAQSAENDDKKPFLLLWRGQGEGLSRRDSMGGVAC